jgi:FixJ family two-component response regulator
MAIGEEPCSMTVSLSSREIEIIELVAEGLTNQEIAERLTISKRTVQSREQCVHKNRLQKSRGFVELGNGSRKNLPRWLQLLHPSP